MSHRAVENASLRVFSLFNMFSEESQDDFNAPSQNMAHKPYTQIPPEDEIHYQLPSTHNLEIGKQMVSHTPRFTVGPELQDAIRLKTIKSNSAGKSDLINIDSSAQSNSGSLLESSQNSSCSMNPLQSSSIGSYSSVPYTSSQQIQTSAQSHELESLKKRVSQQLAHISQIQAHSQELQQSSNSVNIENSSLKKQLDDLMNKFHSLKSAHDTVANELHKVKAVRQEINAKFLNAQGNNDALQNQIKMLEDQKEQIEKDLERHKTEAYNQNTTIQASYEEIESIRKELDKTRDHVSELESALDLSSKTHQQLHKENTELHQTVFGYKSKNTNYDLIHRVGTNRMKPSEITAISSDPHDNNKDINEGLDNRVRQDIPALKRINVNIISRELERQVQPQRHPHQDIIDLDNPPIKANVMQPTY